MGLDRRRAAWNRLSTLWGKIKKSRQALMYFSGFFKNFLNSHVFLKGKLRFQTMFLAPA